MTEKLLDGVWKQMQLAKGLDDSDKDIYIFGIYQGAILLLNICTALLIGIILNMFLEITLYLIFFLPLRIFAGGYHAKTQLRCYIMSTVTNVFILFGIRYLNQNQSIWELLLFIVAFCVIWKLVPVADANKPLLPLEQSKYQKKVRGTLVLIAAIAALAYITNIHMVTAVVEMSVCFLSVILVMGVIKNKKILKNQEQELINAA